MRKTYVLDTNVLIQNPDAMFYFEDNIVVLPVIVLEELNTLKNSDGETGANARRSIRFLEDLRETGNLVEGVELETGGIIRIEVNHVTEQLPQGFKHEQNDNRILKVCLGLKHQDLNPILVTKDIMMRIKAQLLNILVEDFTTEQAPIESEQYSGRVEVYIPEDLCSEFKLHGIDPENVYQVDPEGNRVTINHINNQFYLLKTDRSQGSLLGKFNGKKIVPLQYANTKPYGVSPRNIGQYFLQEALLTDAKEAPLVIVKGKAGTAKTFYALAAGLQKVIQEIPKQYRRILVVRPNSQFDDDIGYLPGSEQEKIYPLMRPIIDNLEIVIDQDEEARFQNEKELSGKIDELFDREIIATEALNYIRGRSITETYLIIDETQNLTPRQAKGIITRAGKGTKIILLGDTNQIDHHLLDNRTNGLSYASEKMKGSKLCYQISMLETECERSDLAADAINRM
ncbi:MAG: PhoH family protein [Clostridiaceae bacterium]|nr:PhoH family protein [Clostridiaceae bacterium]